jgi:hypothetical protein
MRMRMRIHGCTGGLSDHAPHNPGQGTSQEKHMGVRRGHWAAVRGSPTETLADSV